MRWPALVGGIVGLLAAVVLLVAVIGWCLPQGHVAARRARIARPPAEVFAVISDFAQTPAWRPDVSRVELLPPRDGRVRFREHGRNDAVTYSVDLLDPPRRLVTRIADPSLPFGGTWTFELSTPDAGASTELTITERGEVYNPIFRFMSRFVFSQSATIEGYLRALGAKFGEKTNPTPVEPAAVTGTASR